MHSCVDLCRLYDRLRGPPSAVSPTTWSPSLTISFTGYELLVLNKHSNIL